MGGHCRCALSFNAALIRGAIGFAVVSVAGFAPWALAGRQIQQAIGEAGLYAVCAAVFIGLSGVVLHRLIIGPGSLGRFYALFGIAFSAYAIAWTAAWLALRGNLGGVIGLFAGTTLMGWILVRAFQAPAELLKVVAVLFVLNAIGYFGGGWLESNLANAAGFQVLGIRFEKPERMLVAMLLWGACYGLGLGAGLGLAFFYCQLQARALLGKAGS